MYAQYVSTDFTWTKIDNASIVKQLARAARQKTHVSAALKVFTWQGHKTV